MTPTRNAQARRAFTLIELLVVISIIAVMISLLLPVLKNSREGVHRIDCASRLRMLGFGLNQYAFEQEGFLPMGAAVSGFSPYPFTPTWEEMLIRQVNPTANFASYSWTDFADYTFCTRAPLFPSPRIFWVDSVMIARGYMTSYVHNSDIFLYRNPLALRRITEPSRNLFLACGGGPLVTHSVSHLAGRPELDLRIGYENHLGAANLLFADGHVAALNAENVFAAVASSTLPSGSTVMRK